MRLDKLTFLSLLSLIFSLPLRILPEAQPPACLPQKIEHFSRVSITLGAPGLTTRSKDATRGQRASLLGTRTLLESPYLLIFFIPPPSSPLQPPTPSQVAVERPLRRAEQREPAPQTQEVLAGLGRPVDVPTNVEGHLWRALARSGARDPRFQLKAGDKTRGPGDWIRWHCQQGPPKMGGANQWKHGTVILRCQCHPTRVLTKEARLHRRH